jgi:hypothetical protein
MRLLGEIHDQSCANPDGVEADLEGESFVAIGCYAYQRQQYVLFS